MSAKQLLFHDDARQHILRGVEILAQAVGVTLGPRGRTVFLERYNAATCEYGDLLAMGVIDLAKVMRLALQNAGSIAALILTADCLIARAPAPPAPAGAAAASAQQEF